MGGTSLVSCGRLIIFVRTLLRVQQYALIYAVPSPASGLRRYWRVPLFAGNVVLENTRERKFAKGMYCDIDVGLYILRGETMLLIAEFVSSRGLVTALLVCALVLYCLCCFQDTEKDETANPLVKASIEEVLSSGSVGASPAGTQKEWGVEGCF
jgi:hypothetical protein